MFLDPEIFVNMMIERFVRCFVLQVCNSYIIYNYDKVTGVMKS